MIMHVHHHHHYHHTDRSISRFTEVLQDTFLDFFDSDKLKFASATSIRFSPEGFDHFYKNWEKYKV